MSRSPDEVISGATVDLVRHALGGAVLGRLAGLQALSMGAMLMRSTGRTRYSCSPTLGRTSDAASVCA